jgi:poly(3-hydroxybutyrate) depolymerase
MTGNDDTSCRASRRSLYRSVVSSLLQGFQAPIARPRTYLALIAAATAAVASSCASNQIVRCSPYGDPPASVLGSPVPDCPGGQRLAPWTDAGGTPRYACLWSPRNSSTAAPLPLIVFLHGFKADADVVTGTNLLAFISTADLTGNPARLGFLLLSVQGREITHYYPFGAERGTGWDNWYRQMRVATKASGMPPENPDAAAISHFIELEIATGRVDANRIYLSGWSNGGAMALAYGLSHPRVAAIGLYSPPDPFAYSVDACPQIPVNHEALDDGQFEIKSAAVPIFVVHNACDLGGMCPNTERMIRRLRRASLPVSDRIIGNKAHPTNPSDRQEMARCDDSCGSDENGSASLRGFDNHNRWPTAWTKAMLAFFAAHPLNARTTK